MAALTPSAADDRDTSPEDGGGEINAGGL
jgi:hypothetical protein